MEANYDTTEKSWRHLNFFQHEAWLTARIPRMECDRGCGVKKIEVPWSRPGSGFSLLQAAKARARDYRSDANFITMTYLIGGKLNFTLPT